MKQTTILALASYSNANNLGVLDYSLEHPEQALAIFQETGAVDSARIVAGNRTSLDTATTASGAAPELPAIPSEKESSPKRHRWP